MSKKFKKLGRIPLPNKPPKIISTLKRRKLEELYLEELEDEVERNLSSTFLRTEAEED